MKIDKIIDYLKKPYKILLFLDRNRIITLNDKNYIKMQYRNVMNEEINLSNPKTFNEKLQWLKLYNRKQKYTKMVDKYEVKEYVANKIGREYIIPTIGIYNEYNDIKFEELPNEFVMKCTHDSGSAIVCKNKIEFEYKKNKKLILKKLKKNYYYTAREWPYKNVKPRIIIEKYMVDESKEQLKDYKVFCFNGEPKIIQVDFDRFNGHKRIMYSTDWKKLDIGYVYGINNNIEFEKPKKLNKILELSKKLADKESFLRVDFYVIEDKIYFGELTLYPEAGFGKFYPNKYDKILGDWINLKKEELNEK